MQQPKFKTCYLKCACDSCEEFVAQSNSSNFNCARYGYTRNAHKGRGWVRGYAFGLVTRLEGTIPPSQKKMEPTSRTPFLGVGGRSGVNWFLFYGGWWMDGSPFFWKSQNTCFLGWVGPLRFGGTYIWQVKWSFDALIGTNRGALVGPLVQGVEGTNNNQ